MTAWRTPGGQGGEDSGGESGAGARLGTLVDAVPEARRQAGVVLVVWRWYGGTPLGGERWRCISAVAKEALKEAGFTGGATTEDSKAISRTTRKR